MVLAAACSLFSFLYLAPKLFLRLSFKAFASASALPSLTLFLGLALVFLSGFALVLAGIVVGLLAFLGYIDLLASLCDPLPLLAALLLELGHVDLAEHLESRGISFLLGRFLWLVLRFGGRLFLLCRGVGRCRLLLFRNYRIRWGCFLFLAYGRDLRFWFRDFRRVNDRGFDNRLFLYLRFWFRNDRFRLRFRLRFRHRCRFRG